MWGRLAAGWQPARDPEGAPSTAAVRCNRGCWPIDNRPQLTKLPHRSAASLAYHLRSDASPLADESRRRPLLCRTPPAGSSESRARTDVPYLVSTCSARRATNLRHSFVSLFLALTAAATAPIVFGQPAGDDSQSLSRRAAGQHQVRPTCFVENLGQAPKDVLWQAHGAGFEASFKIGRAS